MDFKKLIAELSGAGLTQQDIATACGCAQTTISDIYRGLIKQPAYSTGVALVALHRSKARVIARAKAA